MIVRSIVSDITREVAPGLGVAVCKSGPAATPGADLLEYESNELLEYEPGEFLEY